MEEKKNEVIAGLRSCLVSTKGRCDLKQISDDYQTLMGSKIPYWEIGFKSLEQFILSIPSLTTTRVNGQLLIDAKPSEKSSHIASLVNKQKGSKKRTRLPPRYTQSRSFNQQAVPRWRPKTVQRNWKKTYQSSPRPAAVSHNQFVNVSSSSKSSNLPTRLTNRPTVPAKEITPRQLSLQEEPVSVRMEKKEIDNNLSSDSLASIAKKRISKRMADITITTNNGCLNGTVDNNISLDDWNISLVAPRSAPVLSSSELQKLQKESLAAVDLQNSVWKWSGSEDSSESNGKLSHSSIHRSRAEVIKMEFTGDNVIDLHAFAAAHKLGTPNIKVIPRKGKVARKHVTFYDCHIKIGNHSSSSYPQDFLDEMSAKQAAAKISLDELLSTYNRRQSQSLLISDDKDVLERIPPLVKTHFSGIWNTQLEADYAEIFNEQLPVNWLEIVDTIQCITVLPLLDKRFVLRFCKPGEVFQKGTMLTTPLVSLVSVPSNTVKFNNEGNLMAEITCVASAGEIWCRQLGTTESDAFSEMIIKLDEYYTNVGEYERVDTIEVGGYYAAYHEYTWCRVRVFAVNGNNVNCFCIDFGDEWILQKDSIYPLKRNFALVQAQAFVCRLAGVEEIYEASKSSNYLNGLISKIVQVQLDPNTDDANRSSPSDPELSVILYDTEADSIINEQIVSVISIELAMPILDKNSPTEVYVTYAMDDGSVYVQVHSIGYEQLTSMLQTLENDLLENKLELSKEPITPQNSKDRLYFTQFNEDGHWYRTKIIDWAPDNNYAQIFFIDYGNTSVIKINDQPMYPLDELSDVISQFPEQAVRVRMAINPICDKFADRIKTLMPPDQPVVVKIITENSNDGPSVEFFKRSETDNVLFSVNTALAVETELKNASGDGININGKLQSKKIKSLISLNQFVDGTTKNVPSSGFLSCPPLPKIGNYLDVKIPCAVNPYNFFVQPYESQDKLSRLMVRMQERYNDIQYSPLQIEDVQPGKIYASRYDDGVWYRTSVMKVIHHGSISVFYCDFGYYANLNLKQLVPLDPVYMELPHQAIKAKLAGIEPKNLKWSMDDCKYFEKLVCRKSFVSILVAKEMDDLYRYDTLLGLKLIDTSSAVDVHIDKLLVNEGIAKFIEPHT